MSEKIEASAEQVDIAACDDCGQRQDLRLLDAVLLDEEGTDASEQRYCERCWPKHKIVANDVWRSAMPETGL